MKASETWKYIHAERAGVADTLEGLSPDQWAAISWCAGWTVHDTAGHILAAAEQTYARFYKELASAGFKFHVFTDRAAKRLGRLDTGELITRLRARTSTTNHPPAPVSAMLGEIVTHGLDIRGALGLSHRPPEAAMVAVADNYARSNVLIGSKRRIAGLGLRADDCAWATGDGPEVTGPLLWLIGAMAGRAAACDGLSGEGVGLLRER